MPARDIFHEAVRHALERDGWTITHDPYTITVGGKGVFVDFAAERLIAAERGDRKIAVEVKSFQGQSDLRDLELAVGQYALCRSLLAGREADRALYLAVPEGAYQNTILHPIARPVIEQLQIAVVTFDIGSEEIIRWTKCGRTAE